MPKAKATTKAQSVVAMTELAASIQDKGVEPALKDLTADQIAAFLEAASLAYYNTSKPLISDDLFDKVKDRLEAIAPKHKYLAHIGAPAPDADNKVTLPFFMGSLDKIREDPKLLERFKRDFPGDYIAMDKLDGNSALLIYERGKTAPSGLYSRGDGYIGQNVSHLLSYIQGVPERSVADAAKPGSALAIRGELIISRDDWNTNINALGANARNVVAGAMHAKTHDERFQTIAAAIQFVAYELLEPKLPIQESLAFLAAHGFRTVHAENIAPTELSMDNLSQVLMRRRSTSPFEVDGIVVSQNQVHKTIKGRNPRHAFAFKSILTHDSAEVIVTAIEWNVSKDGYIKPTVCFDPVTIAGAKIQRATGFNAAFIEKNVIGPGSRLTVIRSGDVIPKIQTVLTPAASGVPSLPDPTQLPFTWNDTHVDIMLSQNSADDTPANDDLVIRRMEHFVVSLDVKHVAAGTLKKLYAAGVKSIPALLKLTAADIQKMPGFQKAGAEKIATGLQAAKASATCADLMVASNAFGRGFGKRKIELILSNFPELRSNPSPKTAPSFAALSAVKGLGDTTAQAFLDAMPAFFTFLKDIKLKCAAPTPNPAESGSANAPAPPAAQSALKDMSIVFTGFRKADWEAVVTAAGGKVVGSVSKKTSLLVAADPADNSSKVVKARELEVRILSKEAFAKEYAMP